MKRLFVNAGILAWKNDTFHYIENGCLGVDGDTIPYEYKCRELAAKDAREVWCKLPPIETRVSMVCEGREKNGYIKEGYAFSPMFTLGYTGKLQDKEVFTTWLKLQKAD